MNFFALAEQKIQNRFQRMVHEGLRLLSKLWVLVIVKELQKRTKKIASLPMTLHHSPNHGIDQCLQIAA